jgi:hypothetical protein
MTKKLLYSPGFGAGWTTWESDPVIRRFMLTYQPIIDALERGEGLHDGAQGLTEDHPAVQQFIDDVTQLFGANRVPYIGGVHDITVLEVGDDVEVSFDEYDGSESPRYRDSGEWY